MKKLKTVGSLILSLSLLVSNAGAMEINRADEKPALTFKESSESNPKSHAVFGAHRTLYITEKQAEKLKENGLLNKDGKLLHKDAEEAAKLLGLRITNLKFMYRNYKAPEFAIVVIFEDAASIIEKMKQREKEIKSQPHAVFGAHRTFYITAKQVQKLKENGLLNKEGKLLHKDAEKAVKLLGIPTISLCFMYRDYKAPEFATIKVVEDIEVVFIIDKSGSMNTVKNDTIGSINSVIDEQKELKNDNFVHVTTVAFNDKHSKIHDRKCLQDLNHITSKEYSPNGCTALFDAVGSTINEFSNNKDLCDHKFIFVIITDGYENASKEYKKQDVKKLIEEKKKENWEFVFLGANIDSAREASKIGISVKSSRDFTQSAEGLRSLGEGISNLITQYRGKSKIDMEKAFK